MTLVAAVLTGDSDKRVLKKLNPACTFGKAGRPEERLGAWELQLDGTAAVSVPLCHMEKLYLRVF